LKGLIKMLELPKINPRRTIKFDAASGAYVILDRQSAVRAVLHNQKPVIIDAASPLQAATTHVRGHAELLGLDSSQLKNLERKVEPGAPDMEYRFLREKPQFDVTTVTFHQTCQGWPIWRSAVAVHLKHLPKSFKVISAHIARQDALTRDFVSRMARDVRTVDERTLAHQLGLPDSGQGFDAPTLRITYQSPMVYRYSAKKRAPRPDPGNCKFALKLPPLPQDIVDGSFYTVMAVHFDLSRRKRAPTHWLALVDITHQAVLGVEEQANEMNGSVFLADPATTNGGPMPRANNTTLNPLRKSISLENLVESNPQSLTGTNVKVMNIDGQNIPSPVVPDQTGSNFLFDVRTDNFSAVNAYYNCDRFFSLVQSLGFNRDEYFSSTTFPIPVDHRGAPAMGVSSNDAQTRGQPVPQPDGSEIRLGIRAVVFALAQPDAMPPIGNADDWRVVLHELGGHGTLLNHVGSTKFLFAHSIGDSMAAILNDPESKAPNKDITFPWIGYERRHNRSVADGWSWDGPRDVNDGSAQLQREQILSTTHFNLYKAIGGGSSELERRCFAARFTTYLMLRAVQTLTHPTNPQHASDWLCSLIVADACDWISEKQSGGAYEKVIYWAFQKQGLFGSAPPDVDVYIDDGRQGEYQYQADHTKCASIWNRHAADGLEGHQPPAPGVANFAYVKIKNRGSKAATSVVVNALQSKPQGQLVYPDDWQPMETASLSANDLPPGPAEATVGPFKWTPSTSNNAILMAVSAAGDADNLAKFSDGKSIPDWRLVPHDNNIAMRKI
jgi:hypothetical protein